MKLRIVIGLLALVSGCTYAGSGSGEGKFTFAIGVDRTCEGKGSTDHMELGKTDWTKSNDGTTCKINAVWNGDLSDMQPIKDAINAELVKNGSSLDKVEVEFNKVDLTFHSPGLDVPLPVSNIAVRVEAGGDEITNKSAGNMGALFDGTPVTLPNNAAAAAFDAFQNGTKMKASATSSFDVPMSALPMMPQTVNFTIHLLTDVDAKITIKKL
jgi:hypothetical protein